MKQYLNFVKLDLITIKPYVTIKNFIIFGLSAAFVIYSTKTSTTALGILMGFGTLYITYPFAVGEKNGIASLYIFLGIKRDTVVLGRYLYALFIDCAFCLFGFVLTLIISLIMSLPFSIIENLIVMIALLLFFSFSQFIQIPIYFKNGYTKAKLSAYIPFLMIPLVVVILGQLYPQFTQAFDSIISWISINPVLVIVLIIILWFIFMYISIRLSQKFYQKREF